MREKRNIVLHIASGEINDVELEEEKLLIRVKEEHLYNIIMQEQNIREIKEALKWQGLTYELNIILVPKEEDKKEKDIAFLKEKLGEYLKIN